jgi:hypothetical protein
MMEHNPTLHCEIDHLVITASSLSAGARYIDRILGIQPQAGGKHQRMGTHNLLLRLGPTTYLEIIAVDLTAPQPNRLRWYELDELEPQTPPHLATWVTRVNDLDIAVAASPLSLGRVESMSRGRFDWRITIPPDGKLPLQGILPTLIQWKVGPHPASFLNDVGCSLLRLEGFHPEAEKIDDMLKAIGFTGPFTLNPLSPYEKPYLIATLSTPDGIRQLGGPA